MKIKATTIYDFADRLRYRPTLTLPKDTIVDHVNKEYSLNIHPYYVLFDIIFWNTPPFIYNVVKSSLKHTFGCDMTLANIFNAINELDLEIDSNEYRYINLYKHLHPCKNISLRTDFKKVIEIILCKAFDKEDTWFNISCPVSSNNNMVNLLNPKEHTFLIQINNIDAILSGSFAISMYGYVYRTNIKDFDLLVDYKHLPDDILKIINKGFCYNELIGKNKVKIEKEIKNKFINCEFFNKLNRIFYDKLKIKICVIDRLTKYDDITKVTFVIEYENIEFDLIFRSDIIYETFSMPICDGLGKILHDGKIKVQDINDSIFAKRLLGRLKDFQDLINFKPYTRLNNNGRCVVEYEN